MDQGMKMTHAAPVADLCFSPLHVKAPDECVDEGDAGRRHPPLTAAPERIRCTRTRAHKSAFTVRTR